MRVIRVTYLEAEEFNLDRENEKSGVLFNLDAFDLETRDGREEFLRRICQWVDSEVVRGAAA